MSDNNILFRVRGEGFYGLFLALLFNQLQAFCQEELSDSTAIRNLKGTLTMPEGIKKKVPVVIFISGSGPTDRDGNSHMLRSDYFKLLSEGLVKEGIATFRYDKRGIGKSTVQNFNEEKLSLEDFASDAEAWVIKLKKDTRFSKVILLGHSEGSLLGMLAAQTSKTDAFISLAGAGRSIDVILKEQLEANPYNPEDLKKEANVIIDSLKTGFRVKKINNLLMPLFRPSIQPYMISWMKHDPAIEIAKLKIPCMIVQGTTDIQVSVTDAEQLKKEKPDAKYVLIEGMNHILRDAPLDRAANFATYSKFEMPINESLVQALSAFVNSIR